MLHDMRVLGRLRLSRSTEESTSIERQREIVGAWATANGHVVVGWAEDLDVSGSVSPFDTPAFGPWLNDRTPEFDIIAAWKMDRLGRNAIQLSRLFGWAQDHGKTIVSCSESIDLSTWSGRMLASVIAGLAEGELEAIRERSRSSRSKLRESARWPGGKPPYGYRAVRRENGSAGWSLEIDPESSRVVRRIVESILDGTPINQVASALNSEGVLTPADYHRGRSSGGRWSGTPIRNMLRSKALRGFAHYKGETVRDDDGLPVRLAEPLVSDDDWTLLQAALDKTQAGFANAKRAEASPLSGLVTCGVCGSTLHYDRGIAKGKTYAYYRCPNRDTAQLRAEDLETIVAEEFLDQLGTVEVRERVWVPGDSHEAELREAVTAYDELTSAAGRAQSQTAKQRLQRQLDALDARIAGLESAPAREARWEWRATGETYGAVWAAADADGRRELLSRSGIRLSAAITGLEGKRSASNMGAFQFHLLVPEEITRHVEGVR